MRVAIIKNGVVVNITKVSEGWTGRRKGDWKPAKGETTVITSEAAIGESYDGENFTPPAIDPKVLSYRDKRKEAYIEELGEVVDFTETIGDVLDDLIREVRTLSGTPATSQFAVLTDKIDAIKARFPKE